MHGDGAKVRSVLASTSYGGKRTEEKYDGSLANRYHQHCKKVYVTIILTPRLSERMSAVSLGSSIDVSAAK